MLLNQNRTKEGRLLAFKELAANMALKTFEEQYSSVPSSARELILLAGQLFSETAAENKDPQEAIESTRVEIYRLARRRNREGWMEPFTKLLESALADMELLFQRKLTDLSNSPCQLAIYSLYEYSGDIDVEPERILERLAYSYTVMDTWAGHSFETRAHWGQCLVALPTDVQDYLKALGRNATQCTQKTLPPEVLEVAATLWSPNREEQFNSLEALLFASNALSR